MGQLANDEQTCASDDVGRPGQTLVSVDVGFSDYAAHLQQPMFQQESVDVVGATDKFPTLEHTADAIAVGGELSSALNLDANNVDADKCSPDVIEQFTPVENVADPVEDFSLEAGADVVVDSGEVHDGQYGTQAGSNLFGAHDDDPFAMSQHDCLVADDGFMSVQSEAQSLNATVLDAPSPTVELNHFATQNALLQSLDRVFWAQSLDIAVLWMSFFLRPR